MLATQTNNSINVTRVSIIMYADPIYFISKSPNPNRQLLHTCICQVAPDLILILTGFTIFAGKYQARGQKMAPEKIEIIQKMMGD